MKDERIKELAANYYYDASLPWNDGLAIFEEANSGKTVLAFAKRILSESNRWHYPTKGEYPENGKQILFINASKYSRQIRSATYQDRNGEGWLQLTGFGTAAINANYMECWMYAPTAPEPLEYN